MAARAAHDAVDGSVLLIGAGGLGCAAALALAAGGARRLVVVDPDTVDETNLHRQILFAPADVGARKVAALARSLARRFPDLRIEAVVARFSPDNAAALVAASHVVIDASDNLPTRFLANDEAVRGGKPLVHGAAIGLRGQILSVPARRRGGAPDAPCYRCLFEELPPIEVSESCESAGVLGPVPGVIGALQGAEALRFLRGEAPSFIGRFIQYDAAAMSFRSVSFRPNPTCTACARAA